MIQPVVLAPMPCVHLESAASVPDLPLGNFRSRTSINEVPRWPVVADLDF